MPELTNYSGFDRDRFEFIEPPAIEEAQEVVEETIEVKSTKVPELDIDSALSFLTEGVADDPEVTTDFIDNLIEKTVESPNDAFKMFGELLVVIKDIGHGSKITATYLTVEKPGCAWAQKWSRPTTTRKQILADRSQKTITPLLEKLASQEFQLLEKIDDATYKVTLR
jgi:hypothetical protein